jgi:hypothetical protein
MFGKLAARDAVILITTVFAWQAFATSSEGIAVVGDMAGVLLGASVALCAHLLHEWGHAIGAQATGARIHPPASARGLLLFSFDVKANSRRQFAVMSLSGFAVTAAALFVVYGILPGELFAARVARGGVTTLASITLFIEVPLWIYGTISGHIPKAVAVFPSGA